MKQEELIRLLETLKIEEIETLKLIYYDEKGNSFLNREPIILIIDTSGITKGDN